METLEENQIADAQVPQEDQVLEPELHEEVDYSAYSKAEFKALLANVKKEDDVASKYSKLRKAKPLVDALLASERQTALDKFLAEGGEADDFEYHPDLFFKDFENFYQALRSTYVQLQKDLQQKKENNLKSKREILTQLKELSEKGMGTKVFEEFKKLQTAWKACGPVPVEYNQELWSSYHAIVDRFYDARSIGFELIELDRKKNLELKQALIARAEKLLEETSINKALKLLDQYHDEYKHIGPVPKEISDVLWNKFKEISDSIYAKRKEFLAKKSEEYEQNLSKKLAIIDTLKPFKSFSSERIDDWIAKTKELEQIEALWKKAGLVPKDKVKDTNKMYWDELKHFYNNKRAFFKVLEKEKKENLSRKEALCERAEQLLQTPDDAGATDEIIKLQKEWKNIGHVPLKQKDKIYERFKKACDGFFDLKRGVLKEKSEANKAMVKEKYDFIEAFEKSKPTSKTELYAQLEAWRQLPESIVHHESHKVHQKWADSIRSAISKIAEFSEDDKESLIGKLYKEALLLHPDSKTELIQREKKLRKEIRELEDDLAQYKNNMEFFARSKNADQIRKEFNEKIEETGKRLNTAQIRLKALLSSS